MSSRVSVALALVLAACGGTETPSASPVPPPRADATDSSAVQRLTMPLAPAGYRASAIAIGGGHACALRDGVVECWGRNDYGELGDGTMTRRETPAAVVDLPPVVEITAGTVHSCARTADGAVYCWGDGELGETGDGVRERRSRPVRVPRLVALAITSSAFLSCARTDASGALRCWGSLPSPDPAAPVGGLTDVPIPVLSLDAPSVVGDSLRVCMLDRAGATWCWGHAGSTGIEEPPRIAPTLRADVATATGLVQGAAFLCAAETSGVSCWGSGASSIGAPVVSPANAPARVPSLPGGAQLAAGDGFLCAAHEGETRCSGWGELVDASGGIWRLGETPRVIPALGGATRLAAASSLACAIGAGDVVSCVGYRTDPALENPPPS